MTDQPARTARDLQASSDPALYAGLAAVVIFFVVSGTVSYLNTRALSVNTGLVMRTHEVLASLEEVLSLLKDAETGQRGYLITGDDRYLAPYTAALAALEAKLTELERLSTGSQTQLDRIKRLREYIASKLRELAETIELRRTKGFEAARAVVATDRGQAAMDSIRSGVDTMAGEERSNRNQRVAEMESAYATAVTAGVLSGVLGVLLSLVVAYLVRRATIIRQRQEWLLRGQNGLASAMMGDKRLDALGAAALKFLAEYLNAQAGAFFAKDGGQFRRVACYAVPEGGVPAGFAPGEGLLGQAAQDNCSFVLHEVPEGYLTIGSALGRSKPRHLAVVPAAGEEGVNAVLELGFVHVPNEQTAELLETASETIATAVRVANYRAHLHNLLEETQRQSEELQAQQEELRVSNEELEEQSRTLRESQTRLENQQTELEQTNSQLEEQAQFLEAQRDRLARAQTDLQAKGREIEQASRYKSDFLANMSHELRTPLNSSLILAKLLADNPSGNLDAEQVRYAETIRSAGNDLLNLINDILDLSKIEAGKMDVRPESVRLTVLAENLTRTFEPLAKVKGLQFETTIATDGPDTIETDRQRLEQILKNLLSNAVKFTEAGAVSLEIRPAPAGKITFAVTDSGIGIPEQQQEQMFEAFRQADPTTNRKYGGTGLGLSISRELTRLLGGEIRVKSEPDRGSTFTVSIPTIYSPTNIAPRPAPAPSQRSPEPAALASPPAPSRPRAIDDDRDSLSSNRRLILVVEDDPAFARVLFDLAHELDFQCLVADTAEEGLSLATRNRPNAVVLDVGLPDYSGLTILDRLKQDPRTRHIPVHVISAGDFSQRALALGAAEYLLKPVSRDELAEAFRRVENRLSQRVRRVLVVEDDPVQLESLRRLIGSREVETVGVGTAAQCLELLRKETFDCMILDLTLPDATGYSLLETLSHENAYSFPPVIVYTGRDLSADEEHQLRRYSSSIILKGAKSPERLLDEVTLFLHQVVTDLPPEKQRMLEKSRSRDSAIEGRRILVVEDDVRNVFALTSTLEPRGAKVEIARNGREALAHLEKSQSDPAQTIDLVLMDVMMPEMDGLAATREIRKRPEWKKLPIIMLTAKAMRDDQENCLAAGANDYMAKPLDVEKLLSLVRVWMPH
jgi:CheY-like chemotaxis protein/CHASE3 domain sensor protein